MLHILFLVYIQQLSHFTTYGIQTGRHIDAESGGNRETTVQTITDRDGRDEKE